jgi:anti-sigma regulatory factor (Ser/Thr protein kinase)
VTAERTFAARLEEVQTLAEWVRASATAKVSEAPEWSMFELAVVEAASNTIIHALRGLPEKTIRVTVTQATTQLSVVLEDQGEPMPAGLLGDPPLPEPLAVSGRGLWLIRQGSSDVRYERAGGINRLSLLLRLSA